MKTSYEIPDFDDAASRLSPERYHEYLASLDLTGVILEEVSTSVNRQLVKEVNAFDFRLNREMRLAPGEATRPELLLYYDIQGIYKAKYVIRIKATYRLTFISSEELPLDFFAIYGGGSADIQVWPYLRELASSLTVRMGVPQLLLPLLTDAQSSQRPKSKPKAAVN